MRERELAGGEYELPLSKPSRSASRRPFPLWPIPVDTPPPLKYLHHQTHHRTAAGDAGPLASCEKVDASTDSRTLMSPGSIGREIHHDKDCTRGVTASLSLRLRFGT